MALSVFLKLMAIQSLSSPGGENALLPPLNARQASEEK